MKKKKSSTFHFLYEQTSIVPHSEINILEESRTSDGSPKCIFRARLQESNVVNGNKRKYSPLVCESITSQLSPKATSRNLLMEIDHPMFGASDPAQLKRRATVVEIKNCGSLLRNIGYRNGEIIGEIETLSGCKGPDLANLILKDHVDIGFSLRALGAVEAMTDGSLMVKTPIMPITYDVVSNPSHANAKVMDFIPESLTSFQEDYQIMCEDADLALLEADRIHIPTGVQNVGMFIEEIINERFESIVSRGIQFRI